MKKIITVAVAFAAILAALALSGCGHKHDFDKRGGDLAHHWMECSECGEKDKVYIHTADEDGVCSGCGGSVFLEEDGSGYLSLYDEQGSMIWDAAYDANGETIYYSRYENEYYEDGNVRTVTSYYYDTAYETGREYCDGKSVFERCENPENGDVYLSQDTFYEETGAGSSVYYDELQQVLSYIEFDSNGKTLVEEIYNYFFDEQGNMTRCEITVNGRPGTESIYELDEDGITCETERIYYAEDGSVESRHTFDLRGNELKSYYFSDGHLEVEGFYELDGDGWSYLSKEVYYDSNGEVTETKHYDTDGEEIAG